MSEICPKCKGDDIAWFVRDKREVKAEALFASCILALTARPEPENEQAKANDGCTPHHSLFCLMANVCFCHC
jgi:hypothetical protein